MGDGKTEQSEQLDLTGARVLLVEDEYYIADDLRRTLRAVGATVVGPAPTLSIAMDLFDEGNLDCAVIDLKRPPIGRSADRAAPLVRYRHGLWQHGCPRPAQ